jgi:7-cyano-7-deazaguanine synthase
VTDLVLLSGGVDSTCLAALTPGALCLTLDYGQVTAEGEVRAAHAVTATLGLRHEVISADCSAVGSGLLAGRDEAAGAPSAEWWPFRNQLLVTLAAGIAFRERCDRILVGSVRSDGFHADGTPGFYDGLNVLLERQEGRIRVEAPAIGLTTVELVRKSGVGAPLLGWTFSCHATPIPCGNCPGCNKRRGVLRELELL